MKFAKSILVLLALALFLIPSNCFSQSQMLACIMSGNLVVCPPNANSGIVGVFNRSSQTASLVTSGQATVNLASIATTTAGDYACTNIVAGTVVDNGTTTCSSGQQAGIIGQTNFIGVSSVSVNLTTTPISGATGTLVCVSGSTLISCLVNGTGIAGVFQAGGAVATVNTNGYASTNLAFTSLTTLGDYACSNGLAGTIIDNGKSSCSTGQQAGFIGQTNSSPVATVPVYLTTYVGNPGPVGPAGSTPISVNGTQVPNANFNNTSPAASAGQQNVHFSNSGNSVAGIIQLQTCNGVTIICVDQVPGADYSIKWNFAASLIGSEGGILDARNFTSTQSMSEDLIFPPNVTHLHGPYWVNTNGYSVVANDNIAMEGIGGNVGGFQNTSGQTAPILTVPSSGSAIGPVLLENIGFNNTPGATENATNPGIGMGINGVADAGSWTMNNVFAEGDPCIDAYGSGAGYYHVLNNVICSGWIYGFRGIGPNFAANTFNGGIYSASAQWSGTVTTSGTTVTCVTGCPFDAANSGKWVAIPNSLAQTGAYYPKFVVNGTNYGVASVASGGATLTLESSAGTHSSPVAASIYFGTNVYVVGPNLFKYLDMETSGRAIFDFFGNGGTGQVGGNIVDPIGYSGAAPVLFESATQNNFVHGSVATIDNSTNITNTVQPFQANGVTHNEVVTQGFPMVCTGTAASSVSTGIYFLGWGGNANTCTDPGSSRGTYSSQTNFGAGAFYIVGMTASAITAGVNSSSGLVTVSSGPPSDGAIYAQCTLGTGYNCVAPASSLNPTTPFNPTYGGVLVSFTTQATETLANVTVTVLIRYTSSN